MNTASIQGLLQISQLIKVKSATHTQCVYVCVSLLLPVFYFVMCSGQTGPHTDIEQCENTTE